MVVLDKGNSNGNALVTAEVETYLEGGVAKTANLDSSNKNLKSNVQVSHVWERNLHKKKHNYEKPTKNAKYDFARMATTSWFQVTNSKKLYRITFIKVSKSQKQMSKFSFEPKNKRFFFCPSL